MTTTDGRRSARRPCRRVTVRGWLRLEGAAAFIAGLGALRLARRAVAAGHPAPARPGPLGGRLPPRAAPRGLDLQRSSTTGRSGWRCCGLGLATDSVPIAIAGAILVAHVGMDRAVGYGLKLPTSFHDTHLGRIGQGPRSVVETLEMP